MMPGMTHRSLRTNLVVASASAAALETLWASPARANPHASNVKGTVNHVTFVLNENADSVTYSITGGAQVNLPTTKGTQGCTLGAPTDTFSIIVGKPASTGYGIVTGDVLAPTASGLSQ